MAKSSEQAALDSARELLGITAEEEETEEETPDESEAEEETDEEDAPVLPSFLLNLPDELEEELETSIEDSFTEDEEELEDIDPEVAKRLHAAEKKAAFLEKQQLDRGRKEWVKEAQEHMPLASPLLGEIKATSRTAFLKEAKRLHELYSPFVDERILKPTAQNIEKLKEKERQAAREAAEIAWGRPPGSSGAPSDAAGTQEKIQKARASKDLAGEIKAMMGV